MEFHRSADSELERDHRREGHLKTVLSPFFLSQYSSLSLFHNYLSASHCRLRNHIRNDLLRFFFNHEYQKKNSTNFSTVKMNRRKAEKGTSEGNHGKERSERVRLVCDEKLF